MAGITDAVGTSPLLRVVTGSAEAGADEVVDAVADGPVPVAEVGPLGLPGLSPLVLATRDGETAFRARCSPAEAREVADGLADGLPAEGATAVVDHDGTAATLPTPAAGPLAVGRRRALGRCGWAVPGSVPDLVAAGGFAAERAAAEPDAVLHRASEVGLLGRGRGDAAGDAPVGEEWSRVRDADGDPVVVVNANEADPGACMDRTLLEGAPLDVLDGALAVAAVVGAADVVVYTNEADDRARERLQEARAAVEEDGPDVGLDDGAAVRVQVVAGPDEYKAGEVTMALEAIEGADRLEARRRPPGPAEYGLFGRPTAVHTPRTLVQVRRALRVPDEFDADAADPGTRVLTVAGDVEAPATVELSTDGALDAALAAVDVEGGGVRMACVGGRFGGLTRDLDVPPSAPALSAAGLGTGGVVELLGEGRCALAAAGRRARFAREENCGRCVPCREGTKQLADGLRAAYDGDYEGPKLRELARVVAGTSLCAFGVEATRPVATVLDSFESEVAAHADGRCPAGECDRPETPR